MRSVEAVLITMTVIPLLTSSNLLSSDGFNCSHDKRKKLTTVKTGFGSLVSGVRKTLEIVRDNNNIYVCP